MNFKESIDLVVNFITKDPQYSIPTVPLNVTGTSSTEEFESIIKAIIAENKEEDDKELINLNQIEFDFLINNKLLRTTIQEFIEAENISAENQIEIEYFVKNQPPKPHNSFLHDDWVSSVDTMDNWILSGCYDSTAHIWNAKTGEHKIAIPAHTSAIKAVCWSPFRKSSNEYYFITCSHDETAMAWKWNSNLNQIEHVYTYMGHSRSVDCAASRNDLVATGSYDAMLKVWSLADSDDQHEQKNKLRPPVITLAGHREAISGCVWLSGDDSSESSAVATASMDNTIKIWDIELGEQKQTLTSNRPFMDIDFSSKNGLLLSASGDRHIRLWDPRSDEGLQVRNVYSSHEGWVSSVAWSVSNDHLFVSGSYDTSVKQWDIRSPSAPLYEMLGHQDKVLSVNWCNPRFICSGSSDKKIKIYSTE